MCDGLRVVLSLQDQLNAAHIQYRISSATVGDLINGWASKLQPYKLIGYLPIGYRTLVRYRNCSNKCTVCSFLISFLRYFFNIKNCLRVLLSRRNKLRQKGWRKKMAKNSGSFAQLTFPTSVGNRIRKHLKPMRHLKLMEEWGFKNRYFLQRN
jgi:hypothetical protein